MPPEGVSSGVRVLLPKSAVPLSQGLAGVASLSAVWAAILFFRPSPLLGAIALLFATALPMAFLDGRSPDRITREGPLRWLLGLTLAAVPITILQLGAVDLENLVIAWLVPLPLLLLRHVMSGAKPFSGLSTMFGDSMFSRSPLDNNARLLILKLFFIPLYGLSLYGLVILALGSERWLPLLVLYAYTIDLSIGLSGYVFAGSNAYIQPRLGGWLVCLLCYLPFAHHWPAFENIILQEIAWPSVMAEDAQFAFGASIMLSILALYVFATIAFGIRFANLANRGIITTGPYRWMKHPAYFAHVANAWVLVLVLGPTLQIEKQSPALVLVAFTVLYRLRALTEERHLSEDPDYRVYSDWIAEHGLVASFRKKIGNAGALLSRSIRNAVR